MNKPRLIAMLVVATMPGLILSAVNPVAGLILAVAGWLLVAVLHLVSEVFS